MEFTSIVLYKDGLSFYNVLARDAQTCKARLLKSEAQTDAQPPLEIDLKKDGDQWRGDADEDLLHYLGFDINSKLKSVY